MSKIAFVFIPNSYNGPCITESGPKVFEFILKKNNYNGDYFMFNLDWNESLNEYMKRITTELKKIISEHDKVVVFGGNHLSLLPVYNATNKANYSSLTLDAHRDYLYNDGTITHGSFLRFLDKNNVKRYIIGFRDKISEENKYSFFDKEISVKSYKLNNKIEFDDIKYVDIDVDVLDKKIFPYTVCLIDNGLLLKELMNILNTISFEYIKVLSFSEYAYVLDKKKKGLKIILNIIDKYLAK